MEDIKIYWQDHDVLRKQLADIIYSNPNSLAIHAKEIGISTPSLISFLKAERRIDFRIWCKIQHYITLYNESKKEPR
jgi:hypothetical protein